MRTLLATVALLLTVASSALAQTGACPSGTPGSVKINPNGWVAITPNTDYNITHLGPDGTTQLPTVVRMDLLLFGPSVTNTATEPATQTIDIGKPARNAQNCVWVNVPAITQIPVGQQWKARAVAVGQPLTAGGPPQVSGRSPESDPFLRVAPSPVPLAPLGTQVAGS